jgi:hypothetical protein
MSRHFDTRTAGAAMAAPGMDTRQWCSFGTVDRETADQKSVTFTTAYGPLVNVTLHPSAVPVVCRVLHEVAGNGEGEWFPFVGGDEVEVLINEGSENAGCVIVGRLNQEIDQWPQKVAGQDATKNNFAFRRLRTPYILETASSYLVRNATTGAFFGISQTGAIVFSNADKAFFTLSPNLIGMQNGDADVLLQIDVDHKQVVLEAAGTKMVLDKDASHFLSSGTLSIGTSGKQPGEHATTIEAVLRVLEQLGAVSAFPWTPAQVALAAAAAMLAPLTASALIVQEWLQTPDTVPGTGLGARGLLVG